MAWDDATTALREYMDANWLTTTIAHQNQEFEKPEPPAPFVLFEVEPEENEIAGIGGGVGDHLYRHYGLIRAYVFVPQLTGPDVAEQYAREIGALFAGKAFPPEIQCLAARSGGGGPDEESGNWYITAVSVEFWHDYIG